MKLNIVAVGSMQSRGLGEAVDDYVDRASRYTQMAVHEVASGSSSKESERKSEEADALSAAAPDVGQKIAIDRRGKNVRSEKFAEWLEKQMVAGQRHVSFFIGGAYGLDTNFRRQACNWSLSMSSFTLPHELARVVLAEQLYRALTIVRGEPYHK